MAASLAPCPFLIIISGTNSSRHFSPQKGSGFYRPLFLTVSLFVLFLKKQSASRIRDTVCRKRPGVHKFWNIRLGKTWDLVVVCLRGSSVDGVNVDCNCETVCKVLFLNDK
ncbi:hypothetical protein CDAR_614051 [Caerostris darwini]|uniref:Uncharacterized protein n=1 Tax=Caerostris darwini TaxID=1538125 RepID=A0AAV4UNI6_9ARAC|nr:hypothetical protein CDAR_614051 [Caerostris darwini]